MKRKIAVIILGILILLRLAYSETSDLQKVVISIFDGGQNSYNLADVLEPNQGVFVQNAIISKKGEISKRKGQALFANDASDVPFTGLGTFYPDANTKYLLAASGVSVVRSDNTEVNWTVINPANPLNTGKNTEFIQANNLAFVLNGTDYTPYYNGSVWREGVNSTSSCPIATTGAWLRNYLFAAGNPTNTDWIYFSNNLVPQTFTPTDILKINTGDGQKILKLMPFRLNELIVYKERSIYVLDITGTTPLTDWTVQPITRSIGLAAPRSVVSVGNDQIFLSSQPFAVRTLSRTQYDKILVDVLSQPIQDVFDGTGDVTINTTYISKACAILYDNKYLLAIPSGTSTVNDLVCVYDFFTHSWTTFSGWNPAAWVEFENNLYYIDAKDGRVLQCLTGTTGDFTAGAGTTSASEPLVATTFDYRGKNIDFDNPNNYKILDALDVEFGSVGDYTATAYIDLDDSGWQNIGTISLKGGGATLPVILPFTLSASGVARKTFQLQRYGEFKKVKARFVQNGLSELCELHNYTFYAKIRNWRREN